MDYEAFANALLIVVTGLLTFFGVRKGIKGNASEGEKPEALKLDMAIMNNRAINALAASVEVLNQTVTETNKLITREIHEREFDEEVERRIKDRLGK